MKKTIEINDIVLRFSGDSGDGMQLTGTLFAETASFLGKGVSTFPDYPAEIRAPQGTIAGVSGFQVHVGSGEVKTPGDHCDVLVAMNAAALRANAIWTKPTTTIIVDRDAFKPSDLEKGESVNGQIFLDLGLDNHAILLAPITSLTKNCLVDSGLDNKQIILSKNMFALGICFYLFNEPLDFAKRYFETKFKKKPQFIDTNKKVLDGGFNYAANVQAIPNTYHIAPAQFPSGKYRNISGNQATAWGLMAAAEKAGLKLFCGSYPITPATAILEELAAHKELGVKTLQAEDEIAGICTAIGAAFAGCLAVTTTSGPGFSLKAEAMGLAVMTELPLVVVNVQRGGPSTGLPTKTEQSDLLQALWGRNGECPMIVVAANSPSDCFEMAFMASKLALEHMTPVVLLSDGFIANGSEPWRIPAMNDYPVIKPPIASEGSADFQPYKRDAERLARAWAIPGTPGLEHRIGGLEKDYVSGSASNNPQNHQKMVNVRAEKVARVAHYIPKLEVIGNLNASILLIGWGGTYGHLYTAVKELQNEGLSISLVHFNYINPLPINTLEVLSQFDKLIVCELNSGQFATYLRSQFPDLSYQQFNKIEGLPFTVAEITDMVRLKL